MHELRRLGISSVAVFALMLSGVGCGGDDDNDDAPEAPSGDAAISAEGDDGGDDDRQQDLPEWEGDLPADLSSEEVCELIDEATAAEILGSDISEVNEGGMSTPQCSWWFQVPDGPSTNLLVAVQRAEGDLDGLAGPAAFAYAVELNEQYAGATDFEDIDDLGEAAVQASGGANEGLIVLSDDGRVVTVFNNFIDTDQRVAIAAAVLDGLAANH